MDSREQLPLEFKAGVFDIIITKGLPFADYGCTIDGETVPIYFERKNIGDLYGTLTSGHKRFDRMLLKAREAHCEVILLVEADMRTVASGYKHSTISGDTIIKTIFSLFVRYGLTPIFCADRRTAARFIEETYSAVARSFHLKEKS